MNEENYIANNGYISHIINAIPDVRNMSYLELGLETGNNFNRIRCEHKISVDLNPHWKATNVMTTDEYFKNNNEKFDIIFLDADHHYTSVLKDFNNSISRCKKYLFLHDMFPPDKSYAVEGRCVDAYKLLYYFVKENTCSPIILDCSQGITILTMPTEKANPSEDIEKVTYEEFIDLMKPVKLYTVAQMKQWLRDDNGVQ